MTDTIHIMPEIEKVCEKAGVETKQVYEIVFQPHKVIFGLYALRNGEPYYDEGKLDVARLPEKVFKMGRDV